MDNIETRKTIRACPVGSSLEDRVGAATPVLVEHARSYGSEDPEDAPGNRQLPFYPDYETQRRFTAYMTVGCDAEKAAEILAMPVEELKALAAQERWDERLERFQEVQDLMCVGRATMERIMNRARTFYEAHRLRQFVFQLMNALAAKKGHELDFYRTETSDGRVHYTFKPLQELAKVLEIANGLANSALGDTAGERLARKKERNAQDDLAATSLTKALEEALSASSGDSKVVDCEEDVGPGMSPD